MAGPDNFVRRNDGIVRARIEAKYADMTEATVRIKWITVEGSYEDSDGETVEWSSTFPAVEVEGFEPNDMYRFATPGTSWTEDAVVDEETIEEVDLSEQ